MARAPARAAPAITKTSVIPKPSPMNRPVFRLFPFTRRYFAPSWTVPAMRPSHIETPMVNAVPLAITSALDFIPIPRSGSCWMGLWIIIAMKNAAKPRANSPHLCFSKPRK
ncbi:hypothetical protein [Thermococcus indicus]|uniref:hypothetical protein n=1 Tax=Thermococcus indicus TaxID=2586643 RepID=UPI001F1129D0|nr:hypothetical protein [Thermococcus indicus]